MKPVVAFALGFLLLVGAVTFTFFRGENTRDKVVRTVDPCARPESRACQRRIRLVLRELVRRHPGELRRLGVKARRSPSSADSGKGPFPESAGGGGAGTAPSGGGPVGRVNIPNRDGNLPAPPEKRPPNAPETPEPDDPALSLDAPLVPRVCVGDLVGINCR